MCSRPKEDRNHGDENEILSVMSNLHLPDHILSMIPWLQHLDDLSLQVTFHLLTLKMNTS
jgi:hypothetical protein